MKERMMPPDSAPIRTMSARTGQAERPTRTVNSS
jgi:hypothetical protein